MAMENPNPTMRPGLRFVPTKFVLVTRYLRNMVERNDSSFIKTRNVYDHEPWLLDHVDNDLFKKNEWYYFSKRNLRGPKSVNRRVPGKGESEGGTWKTTGKNKEILDKNKKVVGYKQCLVYNKKVKGKIEKTDWLMKEYSLHKDGDELVLCRLQKKENKKVNLGLAVPQVENNIVLPNQDKKEAGSGNEIERVAEHRDVTQQHEKEDRPILPPPPQSNNVMMQSNANNLMMMSNKKIYTWDDFGFGGAEAEMLDLDELIQSEDIAILPPNPPLVSEDEQYWRSILVATGGLATINSCNLQQQQQAQLQLQQLIPQAQDPGVYADQDNLMMLENSGYIGSVTPMMDNV